MSTEPADSHQPGAVTASLKPATLLECHAVIDVLALQIEQLREQMALLQERLKLDSRNSSKPPSSDGPGSGNRAQRRASQRKRGAQKGHPGSYRAVLPETEVTSVQDCAPPPVCECGGAVAPQGKPVRHQVFDIPPVVAEVREYRMFGGVWYLFTPPPDVDSWQARQSGGAGDQPEGTVVGSKLGGAVLSMKASNAAWM
jgi:Family of unknown function (DUF6444)